jgi:CTP:molybdopterin cytidylyltransferase MocA
MIGAVVLAAGAATRYGSPKQRFLLPPVLAALREAPIDTIVVVAGAHALEIDPDLIAVRCLDWERGPGASLRCGLRAFPTDVEAAVVVLADGPLLSAAAVKRVVDAWRASGDDILAASYDGNRGHPLAIGRRAWVDIADEGLRSRNATLVPCDDIGSPGDVDTIDDLPEGYRDQTE